MISSRTQSFETFVQIYNFYKKKKKKDMRCVISIT